MEKVEFMGLLISKHGIGPTEEKVKGVQETKAPTNVAELRSFLGLITFSSRFIPDFATASEPLRKLTRQGTKWHWGPDQQKAFQILKKQLVESSLMAFYDRNAPTEVITDASPVGLGAILVQEQDGVKRAVCFVSRSLSDVERRYSQTEKEALAVVWACERLNLYLLGLPTFELITDCKALEVIYGPKSKPSARVERWVLRLMPFKFTVKHVPSGQNIADCLSRLTKVPASTCHGKSSEEFVRWVATSATPRAMTTQDIERVSAEDEQLTMVRHCWKTGDWSKAPNSFKLIRNELTVIGKLVLRGMRIVIPCALRVKLVSLAHEGHQGIVKSKERLRSKVWWPGMNLMVERYCRQCFGCQAVTPTAIAPKVKTTALPSKPWRDLAADLMGPLPSGESLLVLVDYYSRWVEVDILRNTSSSMIINCFGNHFSRLGVPETLRTDNGSNFVSKEMQEYLDEFGITHKKTIPYWPRANGEVERQNRSLLKAMRAAHAEGKSWKTELKHFLLAYRSTPHTTTGISPAELMFGRKMRTKIPDFEEREEEKQTANQEVRDHDAEYKQRGADLANKKVVESELMEGDKILLRQERQNKLSARFDTDPYTVVERKGDLLVAERGDTLVKRNVAHAKRFVCHDDKPEQIQASPEHSSKPACSPETVLQPQQAEASILRRSSRVTKEPDWCQDFVK